MFRSTILLAAVLAASVATPLLAQYDGMVRAVNAKRYGLDRAWLSQMEINSSLSHVVDMSLHVSSTDVFTVFEVPHPDGDIIISERDLDTFRRPLGRDGAKKLADEKLEQIKALDLVDAKTRNREVVVPEITLYVAGSRGSIQAINGETGQTRWSVSIGKPEYPMLGPAANDEYVAAFSGSTLFVLNAKDGTIAWSRMAAGVPGAAPAISENIVFGPMIDGRMESYRLSEHRMSPGIYRSFGHIFVRPLVTPDVIAWPTDRGHLYVGRSNKKGILYRLEARDSIVSPATRLLPDLLLATSIDGYVYCVHSLSGRIVWRFSTGEPVSQSAIAVNDAVFAVTDEGNLFRISGDSGIEQWWTSGVKQILAVSEQRVYCRDYAGRLLIIEAETGAQIGSIPTGGIDLVYANRSTDRIYLGTKSGIVQCLHETEQRWPAVHAETFEEAQLKPEIKQEGLQPAQPQPPNNQNPFDNPFNNPPAGNNNANPFDNPPPANNNNNANPLDNPAPANGADKDPFGLGNPFD